MLLRGATLHETLVLFQHVPNYPALILYPLVANETFFQEKINTLSHLKSLQVSPFNPSYLRHILKVSTSWSW